MERLPLSLIIVLFNTVGFIQNAEPARQEIFETNAFFDLYRPAERTARKGTLEHSSGVLERAISPVPSPDMDGPSPQDVEEIFQEVISPTLPQPPHCAVEAYALELYCEDGWDWRTVGNTLLVSISEEPRITMIVKQGKESVRFLEQVTAFYVNGQNLYEQGFATENVKIGGLSAIKVKAFSRDFPDMRLADYLFVRNGRLYTINFSVEPAGEWETHQFLIKKIVDSIKFLE